MRALDGEGAMPVVEISVIVALILLNGFFALAELAVVSARRARLQAMAQAGSRGAALALELAAEPTRFLSTVQIGISLVGLLAGAYGGAHLAEPIARWLEGLALTPRSAQALALVMVVMPIAYLSLTVGELVPKRIALAHAEVIAARVARPMAMLGRLVFPLVWCLQLSVETILHLLGFRPQRALPVSEEEIRLLVAEAAEAGVLLAAEREMIEAVLRIADRAAESVMTPLSQVVWLEPGETAPSLRAKLEAGGHSRFPLRGRRADEVGGVVHTKDLLDRLLAGTRLDPATSARRPLVVHAATPVLKLLELFRQSAVHMALVVDEAGRVQGLATPLDILAALAGDLPEGRDQPAREPGAGAGAC
jgi:putative hemolysin